MVSERCGVRMKERVSKVPLQLASVSPVLPLPQS